MAIDIYKSRRTKHEKCFYYNDAPTRDLAEWVLKAKPTGFFYAQQIHTRFHQGEQVQNVMMFDKNVINLHTSDRVDKLSKGSIILYRGHTWIVDNVQQTLNLRETEFGAESYETFISVRQ